MRTATVHRTSKRAGIAVLLGSMLPGALLLGALPLDARAFAAAQETPPAAPTTGPRAIPIPEIAVQAEAVTTELRGIDAKLTANSAVDVSAQAVPETLQSVDELAAETAAMLRGRPAAGALDQISSQWTALQTTLTGWKDTLTRAAVDLEGDIERLALHRAVWLQSSQRAKVEEAPPAVLARVQATLADLQATRERVDQRRAQVLVLQDQVTRAAARCDQALDQIAQLRRAAARRLLTPDGPPIWSVDNPIFTWRALPPRIGDARREAVSVLRTYVAAHLRQVGLHLALFIVLAVVLVRAQRHLPRWIEAEPALARVTVAVELPLSAATVLSAAATAWIYQHPPLVFRHLVATIALVPFIRIMRRLIDPALFPALYTLAAVFLLHRVRALLLADAFPTQVISLIEIPIALLVVRLLLRGPLRLTPRATLPVAIAHRVGRVLLSVFVLAFVSAALGYQSLARLAVDGFVASANTALFLWAAARIVEGLVAFVLRVRPATLLRAVDRHRAVIERRCNTLVRWILVVLWAYITLVVLQVDTAVEEALHAALTASFTYGAVNISLGDVLAFGLAIAAAVLVSRLVRFAVTEDLSPRLGMEGGTAYALTNFLHYSILAVGFLFALALIGVDLNRFTILAGAFGVGIGFGLQNIVNNFVSGLILLFERPVRVGDRIQIGNLTGDIRRIGFRSSTMRTLEGAEVILPNATLITDALTNWTFSDRLRRVDVPVGVAYGTDPSRMLEVLRSVAQRHPQVLDDPAPAALFTGFGESALTFELWVWTDRPEEYPILRSELVLALHDALREAGIEVPFPQRTVHVVGNRNVPASSRGSDSKPNSGQ